jgi:3-oxoacyl-[acyl-carrier-protein] synthase-1
MSPTSAENSSVNVIGAGAQTAVGRSVLASAAAVRCGVSAFAEHPFMIDKNGEPIVVAMADWLDEGLLVEERIAMLAVEAAQEAIVPVAEHLHNMLPRLRVHLALSAENLPDAEQRRTVCNRIVAELGLPSAASINLVVDGHAGGLLALENACRQLHEDSNAICLVGAADSWLDPVNLERVDQEGRLHAIKNSWGFTPGEGAGFCLLAAESTVRRFEVAPLAELLSVATAQEPETMGGDGVCIGKGLTAAFRGVLSNSNKVTHTFCDFNGEPYRADEYGFSVCRTREDFEDAGSFTAAAQCWGDVGAASGVLSLALPLAAWSRGYGKGDANLVFASSGRAPLRGAALLKKLARQEN